MHHGATLALFLLAGVTAIAVLGVVAPYGRHDRPGWGPKLPARLGWVLMEAPASLLFAAIYFHGQHRFEAIPLLFLGLWQSHYLYRTFVFPLLMRGQGKQMPVLIVVLAVVFNCLNAYVNAGWISHYGTYSANWLRDPRLICGVVLFLVGYAIHFRADQILRNLRRPGEAGYTIPRGWLYEHITCPNYFGEILEWTGWALATWSLAGLGFAVYTVANIGPRAFQHHAWYRQRFPDYPRRRKALIPFLW